MPSPTFLVPLRHFRSVAVGVALAVAIPSCFIDNPSKRTEPSVDGSVDSAPDGSGGANDGASSGPSMCEKYGGYATMEAVVRALFAELIADCRISRFFTGLTAARQAHLYDCLVKQVAVVMRCPGIRYDVDNDGVACLDMQSSHKGLSIRASDFDALIQDLVAVLLRAGVVQPDIDALAPSLLLLRDDIVTNSAPGHGKLVCDAGGGG